MNPISSKNLSRLSYWIDLYILPIGCFVLLTGLFWIGDKSTYIKLYYLLLVFPTIIAILLNPNYFKKLVQNPLIITFILFGSYTLLTLFWSDTNHDITSLMRRPVNILMLFFSFGYLINRSSRSLFEILTLSAKVAAISGLLSLCYFHYTHANGFLFTAGRFSGYGALYNPLLTSHVYGFFTVFWLAVWFAKDNRFLSWSLLPFIILFVVVVSTGSRTPLLAIFVTMIWLSLCVWNKKSIVALFMTSAVGGLVVCFSPEILTSRGLSYRPDIWSEALRQAMETPWFGKGFDHTILIDISTSANSFCDPHNIELAVLLSGGIVGLVLWLLLYGLALFYSWRHRDNVLVIITSALIIFGFAAGLTEGRSFLTRPKVHWFLIWIPLALLSSLWFLEGLRNTGADEKSDLTTHVN